MQKYQAVLITEILNIKFLIFTKNSGSIPMNVCMCRLWNIAMHEYQESVTTGRTDRQMNGQTKDAGQSDLYVPLCFAGDKIHKRSQYWITETK